MNSARQNRTLRTLLIEPFKQLKLGVYVLTLSLAFVIITGLLVVNAFMEQYQHVMEIFQVVDPRFKWELVTNDVFATNVVRIVAVLVTYVAVLFAVVFRATHKYYGPLVSIERFVQEISNGDYTRRVVIRRGDELEDLTLLLNEMAQILQDRHGAKVGDADRRETDRRQKADSKNKPKVG